MRPARPARRPLCSRCAISSTAAGSGAEGDFRCVYVNVESAQAVREDVQRAMRVILGELASRALAEYSACNRWRGTSNSAATRLHQRSVSGPPISRASASETPELPNQRWASSCARVNICAALVSFPLMKISGAVGSARAKPRNSCGSRLRRLLLPTTPLTMTSTPSASACPINRLDASVQVGIRRRSATSKRRRRRMRTATSVTSSSGRAEPTKPSGFPPADRMNSRYQSCRCWQR